MVLASGARLGPYEIHSRVGAGGMGEVYKAHDTRLGRSVAIKVLSSRVSEDSALKRRFMREARAISSLSHPNICALYDIGSDNGRDFLVMEFIEGQTLAERIARGPLTVDEALVYAMEVAAALDRAHRQGIVHRDLKPGNIMLTRSGAKLLDFGLARLAEGSESEASNGPLTLDGGLVGTVEYMAPEHLGGGKMDARSDIFSFGAVLYEMVTGERPFAGENRATVIGAVLFGTPSPAAEKRPDLPVALGRLIDACLQKEPAERVQTTHDLRRELEWIAEGATDPRPRASRRWRAGLRSAVVPLAAIAALAAAAAGALLVNSRWNRSPAREVRFVLDSPVAGTSLDWCALSPDAKRIALVLVGADGKRALWIREISATAAVRVPGSDEAMQPFWSDAGSAIAFFRNNKLVSYTIGGDTPRPLAAATAARGGTWGREGTILFAPWITTGIFATNALGVAPRPVTRLSAGERDVSHRWPEFLPDGRRFLFVVQSRSLPRSGLYLGDVESGAMRKIANIQSRTVVVPDGHVLYMAGQRLYRQPFDLRKGELRGLPAVIAEGVPSDLKLTGASAVSAARDGSVVWLARPDARRDLVWVDRHGKRLARIGAPGHYLNPALSPDGKRLAVTVMDGETGRNSIRLIDAATGVERPFVADDASADSPAWSPDGTRIVYSSDRSGTVDVYERTVDAVGSDRRIFAPGGYAAPMAMGAGRLLVNHSDPSGVTRSLLLEDGKPTPRALGHAGQADLSPDGRWLVSTLHSAVTARSEIFVLSVDDPSRRRQVSNGGGAQPLWRSDGRELYYLDLDHRLQAVAFENGVAATPQPLFALPHVDLYYADHEYAVSPDGTRFLVPFPLTPGQRATATVVLKVR